MSRYIPFNHPCLFKRLKTWTALENRKWKVVMFCYFCISCFIMKCMFFCAAFSWVRSLKCITDRYSIWIRTWYTSPENVSCFYQVAEFTSKQFSKTWCLSFCVIYSVTAPSSSLLFPLDLVLLYVLSWSFFRKGAFTVMWLFFQQMSCRKCMQVLGCVIKT